MVEVLENWDSYVSDARWIAQRGATFLFDENGALLSRRPLAETGCLPLPKSKFAESERMEHALSVFWMGFDVLSFDLDVFRALTCFQV